MSSMNVQADYFLPIISDCTLTASKKINTADLPYLHTISDECSKCNPRYATFARRLAKIAQTMQNSAHPIMMLLSP